MHILDYLIILFLICGFIYGFRKGLIRQAVSTIGAFLVIFLSFLLKNPLSLLLYKHLPFYTIGLLKNYSSLNILLYELISFCLLLIIFSLLFRIILKISGLVDNLLKVTIILELPSKILGGILGLLEYYIILFIILLIFSMPIFNLNNEINNSKLSKFILNNTIILSNQTKSLNNSINNINNLLTSSQNIGTSKFNCEAINIYVDNNIISLDSVNYLKNKNKIDNECKIK